MEQKVNLPKCSETTRKEHTRRGVGCTAVWSDRMLAALERGVPNGWFTLMDKVYRGKNLEAAYEGVRRNKGSAGVDHVSVTEFGKRCDVEFAKLEVALRTGTYAPQSVRRVHIPKAGGGQRPLGIPTVRDRVVQAAVRQVIEPIFEHEFLPCSYGFRPNQSCKDALRAVSTALRSGYTVVVDADIKGFFDSIDHTKLMGFVGERIKDGSLLKLIDSFLHQGIFEQNKEWEPAEMGTPQGGVISPLLANIYLHQLDKAVTKAGYRMVRYADDFVIMCRTQEEAKSALALVAEKVEELKLTLHPDKTHVVDMAMPGGAFEFLGYLFKNHKGRTLKYPRPKSIQKMRDSVRELTPRNCGHSMKVTIEKLNQRLRGWFEYFKHSSSCAFERQDAWIRSRLRHILCKRTGSKSRGHGKSHFRWPNKYFTDLALFSLASAHAALRQSARR